MELRRKGHRLEIYPKSMVGRMLMHTLETRATTFTDYRRGSRSMTVPDKRFYLKNKDKHRYIFSNNQHDDIKKFLENNDVKFTTTIEDREYTPIGSNLSIREGMKLRDKIQRDYSAFLDQRLGSVLCSLQTGKGKTGSTILSLIKREDKNRIALLVSPRYKDIWIEALKKFTDIDAEDILLVSGRASLYALENIPSNIQAVILYTF